jgi:hypothetical protein
MEGMDPMARAGDGRDRPGGRRWHVFARALALGATVAGASLGPMLAVSIAPADPPTTGAAASSAAGTGGGLAVTTVDVARTILTNACLELYTDAGGGTRGKLVVDTARCDQLRDPTGKIGPQDGFVEGIIAWTDLPPASYVVHETLPPALVGTGAMFELAPDKAVRVRAGEVTRQDLVHRLSAGLTIRKVDAAGKPLPGACFSLARVSDGRPVAARCDGLVPAGSGLTADGTADGILVFAGLTPTGKPTTYDLVEAHAPDGYAPVAHQTISVSPTSPTELTIPNTTGTGGGGGKPGEVTSLELEIDSTIDVRRMIWPVTSGKTTVVGRIALDADGSGGWRGSGSLASTTTSGPGAGCPSIEIHGKGTYDWVVREAHAGPEVAAADIRVSMDSGPVNESPDTGVTNDCVQLSDSSTNTWESLFFDVYRRSRYGPASFLVDKWTLVGGPEAWTDGGIVAEATWTGDCTTTGILECTDHTTFRLYGAATVVPPSPSSSPGPVGAVATASPITSPSAAPTAASSDAVPSDGPSGDSGGAPVACDAGSCESLPILPIVLGGGLVITLAFLAWLRFMGSRQVVPLPIQPPTLNGAGGIDPALDTLAVGDATIGQIEKVPPEFEKLPPDLDKLPLEFEKVPPEFEKLPPEFEKLPPEGFEK